MQVPAFVEALLGVHSGLALHGTPPVGHRRAQVLDQRLELLQQRPGVLQDAQLPFIQAELAGLKPEDVKVEITEDGIPRLQEPGVLGNFAPADPPAEMPTVSDFPEATSWLHEHALAPFLEETRKDRLTEVERVLK